MGLFLQDLRNGFSRFEVAKINRLEVAKTLSDLPVRSGFSFGQAQVSKLEPVFGIRLTP